jgi:hypothetical protein
MSDYKRTLTPAPVSLSKPATIGNVMAAIADHAADCQDKQVEARGKLWAEITEVKLALERIEAKFRSAVWVIGVAVGLAGAIATVGVFVARYAIVGAITMELDRRLPPAHASVDAPDAGPHYAVLP